MKRSILLHPFLLGCGMLHAQSPEFTVHPNGLIYSEAAMTQLHRIVDSLNLRFKACELDWVYKSLPHVHGRKVDLYGRRAAKAARDMRNGMTIGRLSRKYLIKARIGKPMLAVLSHYVSDGEANTAVIPLDLGGWMGSAVDAQGDRMKPTDLHAGTWLVEYEPGSRYLEAFYLTSEPVWTDLPERYGRLAQYVDCMIDTTALVHGPNAKWSPGLFDEPDTPPRVSELLEMVNTGVTAKYPAWRENREEREQELAAYQEERSNQLDALAQRPEFQEALTAALAEALATETSSAELEELVWLYRSKADVLALKRQRRVMGRCSMDISPRYHAVSIASLAAESVTWDIFLRAHLDIMNDNFARASDGSYAWGARGTYIRELEELDINVLDLLLGSVLAVDNVSDNHYSASANRTGRALVESERAEEAEQRILDMIADPELDPFNRAVLYYLFLNYNGWIEDEAAQERNMARLEEALRSMPEEVLRTRE